MILLLLRLLYQIINPMICTSADVKCYSNYAFSSPEPDGSITVSRTHRSLASLRLEQAGERQPINYLTAGR